MTKHTPTPWHSPKSNATIAAVKSGNNEIVATVYAAGADQDHDSARAKAQANAAFIVKAVNNHAALVEHLKKLVAELQSPFPGEAAAIASTGFGPVADALKLIETIETE